MRVLLSSILLSVMFAPLFQVRADTGGEVPAGVDLLRRYGWTPLHWAARHGRTDEVRNLLEAGADIEARTHLNRTPLHLAAMAGRRDTVELLMVRGADVNARDRWNVTPLRRLELLRASRDWDRSDIKRLIEDGGGTR